MHVPKRLTYQLSKLADEGLIEFFNTYSKDFKFPETSYEDVIENALNTYIQDESEDVRPIIAVIKRKARDRRLRWVKLIEQHMEKISDISNKKHPFHYLEEQKNALLPAQFAQLYGTTSLDIVIEQILDRLHVWLRNQDRLTEFPLLFQARKNEVYTSFQIDATIDCLDKLITNYGGRISQFLKLRPEILLDTPIFSENPFQLKFNTDKEGNRTTELKLSSGSLFIIVNGEVLKDTYWSFSPYDELLLSSVISFASADFYETRSVVVSASDLANAMNIPLGGNTYDVIKKHLDNLAEIRFRYETPTQQSTLDMLGRVTTAKDEISGKKLFKIDFGPALYESIIKQKTISVTRENYDQLETSIAQLLYPAMQRERINLSIQNRVVSSTDQRLVGKYNHLFFSKTILFDPSKRSSASRAMVSIVEALQEFKDKKIAIDDFDVIDKYNVQIYFLPLSEAEKYDFGVLDETSTFIDEITE